MKTTSLSSYEGTKRIIGLLDGNEVFLALAHHEALSLLRRDSEDEEMLARGVERAVDRGILPALEVRPCYSPVSVENRSPDEVAACLLELLDRKPPSAASGVAIAIAGLSGTGKGTTVGKLHELLPGSIVWSNGNLFRLLAWRYLDAYRERFPLERAGEAAHSILEKVRFSSDRGRFELVFEDDDTAIRIPEVQNTLLKDPSMERILPRIAEQTQGEVIRFTRKIVADATGEGATILLEGRKATLDYIETDFRFELVVRDTDVLGMRRAAQKIAARAATPDLAVESDERLLAVLLEHCGKLLAEYGAAP